MATSILNKYVWLVETIYRAKKITLKEINDKWLNSDFSEGNPIPLRTFHKWRIAVEDLFGLVIECDKRGGYCYYILNDEEITKKGIRNWILHTISVENMLINNKHLNDRILLEEIPRSKEYLPDIIESLKNNYPLMITYKSFHFHEERTFEIEPYGLKLFKRRWYIIANCPNLSKRMIYALDRISYLSVDSKQKFQIPADLDLDDIFYYSYGIIIEESCNVETVVMKITAYQANYLRYLPIHHTQKEIERTPSFSIFEVKIRPTIDFRQELFSIGDTIEVIKPEWLRKHMQEVAKKILDNHQKK